VIKHPLSFTPFLKNNQNHCQTPSKPFILPSFLSKKTFSLNSPKNPLKHLPNQKITKKTKKSLAKSVTQITGKICHFSQHIIWKNQSPKSKTFNII
jgi:hypothetical protein